MLNVGIGIVCIKAKEVLLGPIQMSHQTIPWGLENSWDGSQ